MANLLEDQTTTLIQMLP